MIKSCENQSVKAPSNYVQYELFHVVIKAANLFIVTIWCTYVIVLTVEALEINFLLQVDAIINALCIYLSYSFTEIYYFQLCPCHLCCYQCCIISVCLNKCQCCFKQDMAQHSLPELLINIQLQKKMSNLYKMNSVESSRINKKNLLRLLVIVLKMKINFMKWN